MLGEMIGEGTGKVTGNRVLPSEGGAPKIEFSLQGTESLYGVEATDIGTYSVVMRPDGTVFGGGQSMFMARDGGVATWTGQGIGRFTASGGVSYRGAGYVLSASGSLARLNSTVLVYEFETDADQNTRGRFWEWK
jgi:hypothetical protein